VNDPTPQLLLGPVLSFDGWIVTPNGGGHGAGTRRANRATWARWCPTTAPSCPDVTDVRASQGVVHHYGTMRDGAPGIPFNPSLVRLSSPETPAEPFHAVPRPAHLAFLTRCRQRCVRVCWTGFATGTAVTATVDERTFTPPGIFSTAA
jgi:hypothetical protein